MALFSHRILDYAPYLLLLTVGLESHCPIVGANAKPVNWIVFRADASPLGNQNTVNLIGPANRRFSTRDLDAPTVRQKPRGLSSLCRRSPPLTPVIGIVIVSHLSERLAGSHLSRDTEMHKHSLARLQLHCVALGPRRDRRAILASLCLYQRITKFERSETKTVTTSPK